MGKDGYLLGLREKRQGAFIFEGGERANRDGGRCAVFSPAIPEQHQTGRNGQKQSLLLFRLILITCKPVKNKGIFHKVKP